MTDSFDWHAEQTSLRHGARPNEIFVNFEMRDWNRRHILIFTYCFVFDDSSSNRYSYDSKRTR